MKLEDIARLANVSKSAVSLALNGKAGVSEETRLHILQIVEENNYVPLRNTNKKMKKKSTIRFIACKSPNLITNNIRTYPFSVSCLAIYLLKLLVTHMIWLSLPLMQQPY